MVEPFLVLAVDDHAGSRFAVSSALSALPGVEVIEAASGEDALRLCLETLPHLILLDAHMPGLDGYEVADHLRMASRTRHIPIIFLTGIYKSDEFVRRGYGVGAVDYLLKPVEESLLINRVRFYQFLTDQERKLSVAVDQLRLRDTELSAERDRAEAANHAKDSFLAAMSHEIRTPLNAILGTAHMLIENAQPDQLNPLNNIILSGRHLLIIINDILDLAKIEANKLRLDKQDFRLVTLIETVRSMISVGAAAKNLAIHVDIVPGTPPVLRGDANRLRQALLNYASNAVKFTEAGSVTLRAEQISGTESQATLRFEVEDTGYGIGPEMQAELFKPFSQGAAPQPGGTGLGLVITRRLAQLMEGDAGVHSTKAVGSLFWFCCACAAWRQTAGFCWSKTMRSTPKSPSTS
jgi:signal transduction histidine kinase